MVNEFPAATARDRCRTRVFCRKRVIRHYCKIQESQRHEMLVSA